MCVLVGGYLHDDGAPDYVVHGAVVELLLHVEVEVVCAGADGADELGDVVGVQRAGLGGQAAGQVCEAHVGHALGAEHNGVPPFFTFALKNATRPHLWTTPSYGYQRLSF